MREKALFSLQRDRGEGRDIKFSIITATRNSGKFLLSCLDSVSKQTYPDIDHIVIDGASSDNTLAILMEHRSRLAAVVSEPDNGVYDAMNKGLNLAKGDVIGFLNSDDFYADSDVLFQVANLFLEDPMLQACYADLVYTERNDIGRVVRFWKSADYIPGAFATGWCPPHPTFFVRRAVYERFGGFDLSYQIASDVELMMRFLEVHRIRFCHVPAVWVKMRMGGLSNKNLRSILVQNREILRALHSHGLPVSPVSFFLHKLISRSKQYSPKFCLFKS